MEKFIEVLESINNKMLELQEVLLKKQSALVHGKHSEIGEFVTQEQVLMTKIVSLEKNRIEELKLVKEKYSLPEETNKLEDVIAGVGPQISEESAKRLFELRASIKRNNKLLRRINSQNNELVNTVRQFIRMLFTNIRDAKNSCLINTRV